LSLLRKLATAYVLVLLTGISVAQSFAQTPSLRIAVLDFGKTATGRAAVEAISRQISNNANVVSVDPDQARAAAAGISYAGSLNLSLAEARDLGAAIGCDFFFAGEADTVRRSPSSGPAYFDSYASVFIVSTRTGRLILWERSVGRRPTAHDAEKELIQELTAAQTVNRYAAAMFRAVEDERAERAHAVEQGTPVIEAMSDETYEVDNGTRPPRPFRRLKPAYPEAAAQAQVEAVVDALVDVDGKGEVGRVEIARWAGYGLDESVLATVKQLHFFPAMRNGRAIPMRVLLRYNFRKPTPP
jgi:TonB family protein